MRMHPVPLREFRNGHILARRLKRNVLERRIKFLARVRHFSLHRLRQSRTFRTLANDPKSGIQFTAPLLFSAPHARASEAGNNGPNPGRSIQQDFRNVS